MNISLYCACVERQMWISWTKQGQAIVVYPQNFYVCTLNAKFENSTNLIFV